MAYKMTLGEIRSDTLIQNISAVCHDSAEFAAQVNAVTRRLMTRGGWFNTEFRMEICVQGCRIVWPRQVATVLGVRFCKGGGMMQIKNGWWSIAGYCSSNQWGGSFSPPVMWDDNTAPCYNEITGNDGKYIRLSVVKANDIGKVIRIYGFIYGNQPLQELNSDGQWVPGLTLTAARPYGQTTALVTKITSVQIPVPFEGMSYLYQVDQTTSDLFDLAAYQPGEQNPQYRVSHINNVGAICATEDTYGRKIRKAEALVKLEYIPARYDEDWCMISNLDALAYGIQSLRFFQNSDPVNGEIYQAKAVAEMNAELRNRSPESSTVIRINSIGSCAPIVNAF